MDKQSLVEKEVREEKDKKIREDDFFHIREDDNFLMIIVRRFALVGHAIFAAIAWFFLWMVSTFAG